ncbi:MAG TPA: peptidyl-prolyl cis-trans isomerase [Candidatus Kapabacteria bacterium]|nr:peptidyl-prolyl cis-trans isomerase [Candidatus Kapabacteria bacterium]
MREAMPVMIIAAVVLFVLLIVLDWGMDILGTRRNGGPVAEYVGTVNGAKISYKEFDKELNSQLDNQRQQQKDVPEEMQQQVRDMVWEQFVSNTIVSSKMKDWDMQVSNEQLRDVLMDDPPEYLKRLFTDSSGVFDITRYQDVMTQIANYQPTGDTQRDLHMDSMYTELLRIEDNVKEQTMNTSFRSMLGACTLVSDAEVREKFFEQNAKVDAAYVLFNAADVPDNAVFVSDDSVKAYYAAHPEEFPQEPSRKAKYAFFPLMPSHQDSASVEKKLTVLSDSLQAMQDTARRNEYFQLFDSRYNEIETQNDAFLKFKDLAGPRGEMILPTPVNGYTGVVGMQDGFHIYHILEDRPGETEYAHIRQILIAPKYVNGGDKRAEDDSAKTFANKVVERLKTDKTAKFEDAAHAISSDESSSANGGDIGYIAKGTTLPPEVDKAVFSATIGTLLGPIQTERGFYIVQVLDRGNREVRVHDLKMSIRASSQTRQMIQHEAQMLHDRVAKGEKIDSVAAQMSVRVFESQPLSRGTPLLGSQDFTSWIFNAKLGDVSSPKNARGNVIVFQVTDVKEKGVRPFDEVKGQIRQKLMLAKKQDDLMPKALFLVRTLNGDSLEVAPQHDSTIHVLYANNLQPTSPVPGIGEDFAFNAAAFALKNIGQISDPVRGQRGVYVIQLRRKAVPSDSMFTLQKDIIRNSLITQKKSMFVDSWLQKMKDDAKIEDQRDKFYQSNY